MKIHFILYLSIFRFQGRKSSWLTLMSKKSIDQIMIIGQYYFGPITSRTSRECPTTYEHIHREWSYAWLSNLAMKSIHLRRCRTWWWCSFPMMMITTTMTKIILRQFSPRWLRWFPTRVLVRWAIPTYDSIPFPICTHVSRRLILRANRYCLRLHCPSTTPWGWFRKVPIWIENARGAWFWPKISITKMKIMATLPQNILSGES